MKNLTFLSFILLFFFTMELDAKKQTKVLIHTDLGDIKVLLYNDTPKHSQNFAKLANEGFFNGSIFHRVIKNFMIQGGGAPAGKPETTYLIPAEIEAQMNKKFSPEQRKAYTTIGGTPHLDGEYTVFGEVIEGLDVVDKIAAVQTAPGDKPVQDIKMTVKVL